VVVVVVAVDVLDIVVVVAVVIVEELAVIHRSSSWWWLEVRGVMVLGGTKLKRKSRLNVELTYLVILVLWCVHGLCLGLVYLTLSFFSRSYVVAVTSSMLTLLSSLFLLISTALKGRSW
jgi:hypothetical protein